MQIGRRKYAVASVELDNRCSQVVAPFDIQSNIVDLIRLATKEAAGVAGKAINSATKSGSSAATAEAGKGRHQISEAVRQAVVTMNWLPMELEVMYGQHQHDQIAKTAGILPREGRVGKQFYPVADAMLKQMLDALGEKHEYKFQLFIRTSGGENALSLPGGFLYMDIDLLRNPALRRKGYFALAHEIAHVLQRHETRNAQARIVDTVSLKSGVSELIRTVRLAEQKNSAIINATLTGRLLFERHFSRQEISADACGVRVLNASLTDRGELISTVQAFVDRLPSPIAAKPGPGATAAASGASAPVVKAAGNGADLVDLVSRPIDQHPSNAERITGLRDILQAIQAGN